MLPDRQLVREALARAGAQIEPEAVPGAHYAAVRALDGDHVPGGREPWARAICAALGVRGEDAVESLQEMADRGRSGRVLWSEPVPGALETIIELRRARLAVVIVTNSDGHAAENLRDAGVLAATGLDESAVVDSVAVGSAKPDARIFEVALERAGVRAREAVHVGDMLSTDIAGARAAGITPIHLDPHGTCGEPGHGHIRSLPEVARLVSPRR